MPITFRTGNPDGIYGQETSNTVRKFQIDQGFDPAGQDGRAGVFRLADAGVHVGQRAVGGAQVDADDVPRGGHGSPEKDAVRNSGDAEKRPSRRAVLS